MPATNNPNTTTIDVTPSWPNLLAYMVEAVVTDSVASDEGTRRAYMANLLDVARYVHAETPDKFNALLLNLDPKRIQKG